MSKSYTFNQALFFERFTGPRKFWRARARKSRKRKRRWKRGCYGKYIYKSCERKGTIRQKPGELKGKKKGERGEFVNRLVGGEPAPREFLTRPALSPRNDRVYTYIYVREDRKHFVYLQQVYWLFCLSLLARIHSPRTLFCLFSSPFRALYIEFLSSKFT